MKNKSLSILCAIIILCFCFAQCKKTNTPDTPKTELEKLPPITQTGANTFGCLVDGVAWLPNGSKPQTGGPNIQVYVDPTFQEGAFYITGYQYNGQYQFVSIGSYKCTNSGFFSSDSSSNNFGCKRTIYGGMSIEIRTPENGFYRKGNFIISRYDLINGIFSGTFDVKLYKNDGTFGDTIRITNGRFDVKL